MSGAGETAGPYRVRVDADRSGVRIPVTVVLIR
jgi:hypothetical protein